METWIGVIKMRDEAERITKAFNNIGLEAREILVQLQKAYNANKLKTTEDKQREIYSHYGLDTQLEKLEEECLELALAIKHRDKPGRNGENNIIYEMADVLNLIEQIKENNEYYGTGIDSLKEYKINRQIDRINRHD